jgi:hypothetical protein
MWSTVFRCNRESCWCVACGKDVSGKIPICRACNPAPAIKVGKEGPAVILQSATGPGTELSKLLKRFGIEPTPTCKCRAKAAQMDAWGCDECAKPGRIEEVVAVMRDEAKARSLPFLDAAGRVLVRRAISNARKELARAEKAATAEGSDEA